MTQYEFIEDILDITNNQGERVFIDLNTFEVIKADQEDDIRYLFEQYGMGEKNPIATEEQKEEWYQES